MNLKTRLKRLQVMDYKFCSLCGADWQLQRQRNRQGQIWAKEVLREWSKEEGVDGNSPEFMDDVRAGFPHLVFFASYRENSPFGWSKDEIPTGYCLRGSDLLPAEQLPEVVQLANQVLR